MLHNVKTQRGMMDRSFISIKCAFWKDMTHAEVLTKCIECTWKGKNKAEYYLSDGSGCKVPDEQLTLRIGQKSELVPWTLGNYMKACNTYASKTRLYCVYVGKSESTDVLTLLLAL